ncbi:MAG: tRNA (adenosine(37)-N6)-threonylcarbamoyltransferase complex dimerization subunit type 1 TsaB [Pseudomonadota bacterium]
MEGSTPVLSIALVREDGEVLASLEYDHGDQGESHSRLLPGVLDALFARAELGPDELSGVAVGIGPGAFTGLRVILATAKGIAYARRLPLVGVSTLEALALAAPAPEGATVVPVLDARKKEIYAAVYRREGEGLVCLSPRAAMPPERLAEMLAAFSGPLVLLGQGYRVYREILDRATEGRRLDLGELPRAPRAQEVARLAFREPLVYDREALFGLEPDYVRKSDAELGWKRPERPTTGPN